MTIFTDKARTYVPRLQKDLSITEVQACGIFGNLGAETGGFTALQEKAPIIKGSRGGYGWMQWTGPRRRKYEAWCAAGGKNAAADETNYQYLVHETLTDEAHSLVQLRKTTSLEAAAYTFMKLNLRPGIEHLDARVNYAKKAFDAVKDSVKETKQVATVGAGGAIAIGTVVTTEPKYWPWILGALAIAGVTAWIWSKRQAEAQKLEEPATKTIKTKKGKKNGKGR